MKEKQNTELRAKLKEDLQKILIDELSEKTGFDKKTGLLPDGGKRFVGMPYIGQNYGKDGYPRILVVGSDIGSDERVDADGNPKDGENYYHTFETKEKACVLTKNVYNAHLSGTYMTALYLLKDTDDTFKEMWSKVSDNATAYRNLKKFNAMGDKSVELIASFIAFTNIHHFVTERRKFKSGGNDRKEFQNGELDIFIEEVKCFAPDIIILQTINSISSKVDAAIREISQVYTLRHPSTRVEGGRLVSKLIINPLRKQGYKD